MSDKTDTDIRPLTGDECEQVGGGLRRGPIMTTMAIGEEDFCAGGGWATTLAIGEEDPGGISRKYLPLDAGLHLKAGR